MTGAWIDEPEQTIEPMGRGARVGVIALAVVAVSIVLAIVVWARFLSGVNAAPVPATFSAEVPAAAAPSSIAVATPSATDDSRSGSASITQPDTVIASLPDVTTVSPQVASASSVEPPVDAAWLDRNAAATGISRRALQAYAGAELELDREKPSCRLGWNTLAGIGKIESNHGRTLTAEGYSISAILGPAVGTGLHAEGPMQFMPSTWKKWGADGNGDGVADPNQIDDATLAAARYLCSYGSLDTIRGWHAAVFGYNHLESYVAAVAAQATAYAQRAEP